MSPLRSRSAGMRSAVTDTRRSEEHTSELQSQSNLVCRLLLEKKKTKTHSYHFPPRSTGYFLDRFVSNSNSLRTLITISLGFECITSFFFMRHSSSTLPPMGTP